MSNQTESFLGLIFQDSGLAYFILEVAVYRKHKVGP